MNMIALSSYMLLEIPNACFDLLIGKSETESLYSSFQETEKLYSKLKPKSKILLSLIQGFLIKTVAHHLSYGKNSQQDMETTELAMHLSYERQTILI